MMNFEYELTAHQGKTKAKFLVTKLARKMFSRC